MLHFFSSPPFYNYPMKMHQCHMKFKTTPNSIHSLKMNSVRSMALTSTVVQMQLIKKLLEIAKGI